MLHTSFRSFDLVRLQDSSDIHIHDMKFSV